MEKHENILNGKSKFIEGYRIRKIKKNNGKLHWLFLPGGPGMGAEYFIEFINKLKLPGKSLIGDFPGDGSNTNTDKINYRLWKNGLLQVVKALSPCVLVTHSFSGMFALTVPELEDLLLGLVIISSSPDKDWLKELERTIKAYNLPALDTVGADFYKEPTNHNLKLLFRNSVPYLFLPHELTEGKQLLQSVSYNAITKIWADKHFHPRYIHKWCPRKLSTLIVGSKDDRLLPIKLFIRQKKWSRENIKMLVLEGAGHFPWITHFAVIQEELKIFSKNLPCF